jgi:hypothetical protein
MRVLITNIVLDGRSGTETVTRDIALELRRIGHDPIVYSPRLGEIAKEIRDRGIVVTDDITTISDPIDVIHGHHLHTTATAIARFPHAPAIFVCHDFTAWHDQPPKLPSIRHYVAIGPTAADRLRNSAGVNASNLSIIPNGVDLARFTPGKELSPNPQKAIAFCNIGSRQFAAVISEACERRHIRVDLVGRGVDNVVDCPEDLLSDCDLVFASGRSAREALACQRAVICCDGRGLSGMISSKNFGGLQQDFGLRGLRKKLSPDALVNEIDRYDAADAYLVGRRFRAEAGMDRCVAAYLEIYNRIIAENGVFRLEDTAAQSALAAHLQQFLPGSKTDFSPWIREREMLLEQLQLQLEQAGQVEQIKSMFLKSTSWRLTRPLRSVGSALREVRRTCRLANRFISDRLLKRATATASVQASRPRPQHASNRIVAILPVRNSENDLPAYFRSISRCADAVIALDDGSIDRTGEILREEALVCEILSNPRRDSYVGWNDSENRSRLLDACRRHSADWILQVDADELLDESEALALRHFVATEALPNVAYGFLQHRMIGGMQHFDRAGLWVYRLFRYRAGQKLSPNILHFEPVPTSIPRDRWVRTRFRIKHGAGLTEAKRRARYEKYLLADPERRWQGSYENLLDPPGQIKPFEPFDSSAGFILDQDLHERLAATPPGNRGE